MAAAELLRIRIGDTLHVFDEQNREGIEKCAKAALENGNDITWQDGTRQYIIASVAIKPNETGSGVYTWDKKGDKVLYHQTLVTISPDGTRTEQVHTDTWRKP